MNIVTRAARQIERRMSVADLDLELDMRSSGQPTYSGKLVSPSTALRVTALWSCISVLADDFATLPLPTYRRIGESYEIADEHYLWPLFMYEANPVMTAFQFKQLMMTWVLLYGNAYAEMETNGRGQIIALWPWRPDRVKIYRPCDSKGNTIFNAPNNYEYTMSDGRTKIWRAGHDVFHMKGLGLDGDMGLSPIEMHKQSVGFSLGLQEHGARYFSNGAAAGAVLQYPGKLTDKSRESITSSWAKEHQGLDKAWRIAILEEGMTYKETTNASMVDADYLNVMKFSVQDIARIFKVPPHRIGDLEQSTNNNIEHQGLEYVLYSLGPWAANWESQIEFSMLSPRDRALFSVRARFRNLIRGDMAAQAAFYGAMVDKGIMTQNDVRREIDLNPFKHKLADEPWKQINTAPAGESYTPKQITGQTSPSPAGITQSKPNGKAKEGVQ